MSALVQYTSTATGATRYADLTEGQVERLEAVQPGERLSFLGFEWRCDYVAQCGGQTTLHIIRCQGVRTWSYTVELDVDEREVRQNLRRVA